MKSNLHKFSLQIFAFVLVILIGTASTRANSVDEKIDEQTIQTLKGIVGNPQDQVIYWRSLMPNLPNTEAKINWNDLPADLSKRRIENEEAAFSQRIQPALNIYNKHYKVLVINFDKPYLEINNDSLLIASNRLLKEIKSDDELFGLILHETAHSIFKDKAAALQIKNGLTSNQKAEAIKNLAMIELMCDFIAAQTLKTMNLDSTAFLKHIVEMERRFEVDNSDSSYHPSGKKRLEVISTLLTK